jgi:ParB-like chromosome segregation protein Spo0J
LESWQVDKLIPSPRNARTHSAAQIAEIAGCIRTFGFSNPILVGDDGDIVAGHGRLAAARQLGLSHVPVIVLSGLSEAQRRQLMLADNRIGLNAGWDLDMLRLELKDLKELGANLAALGFSAEELAKALSPPWSGGLKALVVLPTNCPTTCCKGVVRSSNDCRCWGGNGVQSSV